MFIGILRPDRNSSSVVELVFTWYILLSCVTKGVSLLFLLFVFLDLRFSTHVYILSYCYRKSSPIPESLVLHIGELTRNVNENHLREIFGMMLPTSV